MNTDLFQGRSIPRTYFKFCLPLVCSMVISVFYNLADTYFVSQTGNTSLVAGVSLCAPLLTLLMAFGNIFGQGGSSLISRFLGTGDTQAVKRVSSFCFYSGIVCGLVLTAILLLFRTPILYMMGATSETFSYASSYYAVLSVGAALNILNFIHPNFLRAEGMSVQAMIASIGGSVVNIILDPIFISGFRWGAMGAAVATVLGYVFTDIYCIAVVVHKSKILSVQPRGIRLPGGQVRQILSIGLAAAVLNIAQTVCQVLLNQVMVPYGTTRIAALGIAMKIINVSFLILVGFAYGPSPLFGYLYGARDMKKLKTLIRFCFTFESVLALAISVVIFAAATPFMSIFLKDPDVITSGAQIVRWQIVTMVFAAAISLMMVLFQATGKATAALVLSLSRQGVIFVVVLFLARALLGYTGVLASQAISDVISMALAIVLYRVSFRTEK